MLPGSTRHTNGSANVQSRVERSGPGSRLGSLIDTVMLKPQWRRIVKASQQRFFHGFLVPIAFATTVPAQALAGHLTWRILLGAVALALALFLVSRVFWQTAIRRYSGASA